MNNSVFGKTMENVRNHRNIKLVTTDKRRNQLLSEPNYHTKKYFSKNLLAIEVKKMKVNMNKSVYLGLSILEISKILMYEFWYDYIKPKYQDSAKLCYMDQIVLLLVLKLKMFMKVLLMMFIKDLRQQITSAMDHCLKNKNVIGLMKDELGGKIMTVFVALRPKTYYYLMDDGSSDKKATKKGTNRIVIKFNDYKDCLLNNEIILKSQQRFKSEAHNVYTEEFNKIAISNNDVKRLQTYDIITSYPYGTSAGKVF